MIDEAASVAGLPEALFAGRQEGGRDGVAEHLVAEHDLLWGFWVDLFCWQGLYVAHDARILALQHHSYGGELWYVCSNAHEVKL